MAATTTTNIYNDEIYEKEVSSLSLPVPGLFTNFASSAKLLRMAKSELRIDLIDNGLQVVDDFYELLDRVDAHVQQQKKPTATSNKFIIEVEGLDG